MKITRSRHFTTLPDAPRDKIAMRFGKTDWALASTPISTLNEG